MGSLIGDLRPLEFLPNNLLKLSFIPWSNYFLISWIFFLKIIVLIMSNSFILSKVSSSRGCCRSRLLIVARIDIEIWRWIRISIRYWSLWDIYPGCISTIVILRIIIRIVNRIWSSSSVLILIVGILIWFYLFLFACLFSHFLSTTYSLLKFILFF